MSATRRTSVRLAARGAKEVKSSSTTDDQTNKKKDNNKRKTSASPSSLSPKRSKAEAEPEPAALGAILSRGVAGIVIETSGTYWCVHEAKGERADWSDLLKCASVALAAQTDTCRFSAFCDDGARSNDLGALVLLFLGFDMKGFGGMAVRGNLVLVPPVDLDEGKEKRITATDVKNIARLMTRLGATHKSSADQIDLSSLHPRKKEVVDLGDVDDDQVLADFSMLRCSSLAPA